MCQIEIWTDILIFSNVIHFHKWIFSLIWRHVMKIVSKLEKFFLKRESWFCINCPFSIGKFWPGDIKPGKLYYVKFVEMNIPKPLNHDDSIEYPIKLLTIIILKWTSYVQRKLYLAHKHKPTIKIIIIIFIFRRWRICLFIKNYMYIILLDNHY